MERDISDGRDRLPTAVHEGTVRAMGTGDLYVGRVIYVKLSRPLSLDPVTSDAALVEHGRTIHGSIFGFEQRIRDFECDELAERDFDFRAWSAYLVDFYAREYPGRFPHWTTADQSLYINQSAALTGLGYLVTQEELAPRLEASSP